MHRKLAFLAVGLLAALCLFTVISAIFLRANSFCRPGQRYFCPGGDFTLRMNEVECLRRGVNPFSVWHEDVELEPYISTVTTKEYCATRFYEPINAYPPWAYSMALPLSFLPRDAQWGVYFAFMFLCVGVVLFCGFKAGLSIRGDKWDGVLVGTVPLVISFYPIWSNFSIGNYAVVVLAALSLMALLLNRGHDVLAGFCWAVAMVKPQMALLFAVPLLYRRKFTTCVVAACTCLLLSVPPALMCGDSIVDMIIQAPTASAHGFNGCGTFPYFLCKFTGRSLGISCGLLTGICLCVFMTWLVKRRCDWFVFMMPAAVCSMSWTYCQMFTYMLGWFVFVVLTVELARGAWRNGLLVLSAFAAIFVSRAPRIVQCVFMVLGAGSNSAVLSQETTYHIDSINSTVSVFLAFALCILVAAEDANFRRVRNMLAAKTTLEFLRYIVVGGLAFVVDVGTLVFCREMLFPNWHGGVYLSVLMAFFAGHLVNYVGSLYFVFCDPEERRNGLTWKAFWLFAIVGATGVGATELGMLIGYGLLHMNYVVTKILVAAIVFVWNFAGRKIVVRNRKGN